eukprot:NODE_3107_length_829_cov_178.861757.p5 GENE.NODE_3107_length_829_cov_178.861757~~NODE_3107_length_829_cov_178.861757.p5  ORF type:complete len:114 (-),score=43.65 NODE_3107_length_829_cov_178.861757:38-379(-)
MPAIIPCAVCPQLHWPVCWLSLRDARAWVGDLHVIIACGGIHSRVGAPPLSLRGGLFKALARVLRCWTAAPGIGDTSLEHVTLLQRGCDDSKILRAKKKKKKKKKNPVFFFFL